MKVIFLDIDGVLVNRHFWFKLQAQNKKPRDEEHTHLFDPVCISNLNELVEKTGAKIVISSTWRYLGIDRLREIFKRRNMLGDIIGLTTIERFEDVSSIYSGESRGRQIQEYLDTHPEIENYVIIDDDSDMLESQMNNFVHTTFDHGFLKAHLDDAIKILNK